MRFKFKKAAIGGTFDRLHKGHEYFIQRAFEFSEKVIVGLTSNEFAKSKRESRIMNYESRIMNYEDRKRELEEFLQEKGLAKRAEIVMINDIYGPTLKDKDIDVLVVTGETKEGGEKVNKRRRESGLSELKIIEVPLVSAGDRMRISSTRIRLGEIDRWGKVFEKSNLFGAKISDSLRAKLKKPLGKLIKGTEAEIRVEVIRLIKQADPVVLVSVGDDATSFLNKINHAPDLAVVDFHVKRVKVHESLKDLNFSGGFYRGDYENKIITVKNPAGFITRDLTHAMRIAFSAIVADGKLRVVKVDGEEDLAGIPAILLAPLGSLVLYGQPGIILKDFPGKPEEGIVAVSVTEGIKEKILKLGKIHKS